MSCARTSLLLALVLSGAASRGDDGVVRLTPGVNGAASPRGGRIAFQKRHGRFVKLGVYDLATCQTRWVEDGAVCAAFPAWSSDGSTLIYALGDRVHTAYENWQSPGCREGYRLRTWRDGVKTDVLEHGRWYDCSPSFAPDGSNVWYCSNRAIAGDTDGDFFGNRLWRMTCGRPQSGVCAYDPRLSSAAGVSQPVVSPGGRVVCWAELADFSQSWCLKAAHPESLADCVRVTPVRMAAYAPNWRPDGRYLTFTGCSPTDTCWSVYLMDPRKSLMRRVCAGENSSFLPESGRWSVVFDRDGHICRRPLAEADYPTAADYVSGTEGIATPWDEPEKVLFATNAPSGGEIRATLDVANDPRFVFDGEGTSFWRVTFDWNGDVTEALQSLVLLSYAESGNGSQLYLALHGKAHYSTRQNDAGRTQAYAYDPSVLSGRGVHTITGIRSDSCVRVSVDDGPVCAESAYPNGLLGLKTPRVLRIGADAPADTRILSVTIGSGWPAAVPKPRLRDAGDFDWEGVE